jgi:hypothetical protein
LENTDYSSVRRLLLEMTVPYTDSRGDYPSLFTSADHVTPVDSTLDIGVTFRLQHARYAQNVIENLAMHFKHRCGCSQEYLQKVFKTSHLQMMRSNRWHPEHQKVYDPKHMQEGLSASDLSHIMAEFNLDISVVLQDAAMAVSRAATVADGEGVSAPRAASNASQQLSQMNSIMTFRVHDENMEDTAAVDELTNTPAQNHQNPYAWAICPGSVAIRISQALPSTAVTTNTASSADTTIQTTIVQEDSSLTTMTEHIGMTEAQIKTLLEGIKRKWQAKLAEERALRVAEQNALHRKQPPARNRRRNRNRDQTAQQHRGGPSP